MITFETVYFIIIDKKQFDHKRLRFVTTKIRDFILLQ